jgi:two-component system, OmpR family, response regulator
MLATGQLCRGLVEFRGRAVPPSCPQPDNCLLFWGLRRRSALVRHLYAARAVTILLLETDPERRAMVASMLERAGFEVRVGSNAADVAGTGDLRFDLVVIGGSDSEDAPVATCREVRRLDLLVPVVVVGCDARDGVAALEAGADDFVTSPLNATEIVARIRALLRRAEAHSPLHWGVLKVDRVERIAYLRGQPLSLTTREFALLTCLVQASGRMVSRTELLWRVWGRDENEAPTSNSIEVHLSRLRDKLGSDAAMIETVRRIGYRLRKG